MLNACLSHASRSSCYQLLRPYDHLIRPLRSSPITSLHRYFESVRPSAPHRYARLAVFAACASPLASERLVPAVPRNSLHPLHAPSTPVAARSVTRHPTDLSQAGHSRLVLTTLGILTTRHRGFTFVRLPDAYLRQLLLALLLQRSPPQLFTAAAWSDLRSAPESRSRGAVPHLSRSLSTWLFSSY